MRRMAICCTSSSRRCPTGAPTAGAARWRTACGWPSRSPAPCRKAVPKLMLGARISVTDWVDGGLPVEEGIEVATALKACRRRLHLLLERRQFPAPEAPDRPRLPGASGRSGAEGGRHSDPRRRHDRRAEAGRGDRRRRPRRHGGARARVPRRPALAVARAATLGHEFKTAPQLARAAHLHKQWVEAA